MMSQLTLPIIAKTTACRRTLLFLFAVLVSVGLSGCGSGEKKADAGHEEEEAESRTEFTDRIENFFEYDRLQAGKTSQFLIHLTDLSDGSPVEKADVVLTIRNKSGAQVGQTKAKVGKVTGIYVAEVSIPIPGDYDIEFHVKNAKLDERMPLTDFKVE